MNNVKEMTVESQMIVERFKDTIMIETVKIREEFRRTNEDQLTEMIQQSEHLRDVQNHSERTDLKFKQLNDEIAKLNGIVARSQSIVEFNVEDMIHKQKKANEDKMYRFCDSVLKEFRFLNQRQEDKIFFQLGYYQQMPTYPGEAKKLDKLSDLISESYM